MITNIRLFLVGMKHAFICGWYRGRYDRSGNEMDRLKAEAHEYLCDLALERVE